MMIDLLIPYLSKDEKNNIYVFDLLSSLFGMGYINGLVFSKFRKRAILYMVSVVAFSLGDWKNMQIEFPNGYTGFLKTIELFGDKQDRYKVGKLLGAFIGEEKR